MTKVMKKYEVIMEKIVSFLEKNEEVGIITYQGLKEAWNYVLISVANVTKSLIQCIVPITIMLVAITLSGVKLTPGVMADFDIIGMAFVVMFILKKCCHSILFDTVKMILSVYTFPLLWSQIMMATMGVIGYDATIMEQFMIVGYILIATNYILDILETRMVIRCNNFSTVLERINRINSRIKNNKDYSISRNRVIN